MNDSSVDCRFHRLEVSLSTVWVSDGVIDAAVGGMPNHTSRRREAALLAAASIGLRAEWLVVWVGVPPSGGAYRLRQNFNLVRRLKAELQRGQLAKHAALGLPDPALVFSGDGPDASGGSQAEADCRADD